MMYFHNAPANREAQATAICMTIDMGPGTIKCLEDAFPFLHRNPFAEIYNLHTHVRYFLQLNDFHIRQYFHNSFRILSHIFHEIEKSSLQLYKICINQWQF